MQATEHDKPVISIDYGCLPTGADQTTDGGEEAGSSPFLVCADSDKKALLAEFAPSKGEDPYAVKRLTEHLLWLGHTEICFKADGEPAIGALRRAVSARLREQGVSVTPDTAPKGDSNSNPWAEGAVDRVKQKARILWHWAVQTHGGKQSTSSDLIPWCIRYSAQLANLTHVSDDGKTPYRRVTGRKEFPRPLVPWCSKVGYVPGGAKAKAALSKWEEALFVGFHDATWEYVVLTPDGPVRSRDVKLLSTGDGRDPALFTAVKVLPWDNEVPPHTRLELRMPAEVVKGDSKELPPVPVPDKAWTRRVYIRANVELAKYGYTPGCVGCNAVSDGKKAAVSQPTMPRAH